MLPWNGFIIHNYIQATDILIHTRSEVVICTRLEPKTDNYQTCDILPVSQVDDFYRYETNMTVFWVVSKPVVHSRKHNFRPNNQK